jgi:hypothetical protein
MTLPHEELRSLKMAKKFIVEQCLWQSRLGMLKMILSGRFNKWKVDAYYSIKHYPFDCHIDQMYEDKVCMKCEDSKRFCKCKKGND